MPKLIMPIPETELSVTRPVILEITRKLCRVFGISPNTLIYFPLEGQDKQAQAGSVIGTMEREEANYLPFSQKIRIDVDEQFNDQAYLSAAIHKPEQFPIFVDDCLSTRIKPVYTNNEYTINFKFRTADKVLAERFRDEVRTRWADGREVYSHSVSFHWEPPHAFIALLKEIYRLRENVLPYGETWDQYLTDHTDARSSDIVQQNGQQPAWNISETQGNIIGYFDFSGGGMDKGGKEDEGDTWMLSFAFKFRFEKPIMCEMHYPISVHNQVLGQQWRPALTDDQNRTAKRSYTRSADALKQFRAGDAVERNFRASNGYDIPTYDEFIPLSVVSDTMRVVTVLPKLNLADTKELINFGQLGRIQFTSLLLDFLAVEAPHMPRTYNSVFIASLYDGIELMRTDAVTVDQQLNVRAVEDMDPRRVYHVRLGLVTNWALLTQAAIDRLAQNGAAAIEILKVIAPWLELPILTSVGSISKSDMQYIIDQLSNRANGPGFTPPGAYGVNTGQHIGFNTVGALFVVAMQR